MTTRPPIHGRHRAETAPRGPLCLHNLRLPFAIRLTAHRGCHRLSGAGRTGVLAEGASFDLPAFQTFHYEGPVIEDAEGGHRMHLHIDQALASASRTACDLQTRLAIRISRAAFRDPGASWTLDYASHLMAMTKQQFAKQLFREGSALTQIVREQRLMRALLAVLNAPPGQLHIRTLAAHSGFAPHTRFGMMFSQHFGCSAGQLAQRAWSPALTWSAADRQSLGR